MTVAHIIASQEYRDKIWEFEDTGLKITLSIVFLMAIRTRLSQRRMSEVAKVMFGERYGQSISFVQTIA
jgi:CO dehydrogenase/acetyl-CoA synthase delta subunit